MTESRGEPAALHVNFLIPKKTADDDDDWPRYALYIVLGRFRVWVRVTGVCRTAVLQ